MPRLLPLQRMRSNGQAFKAGKIAKRTPVYFAPPNTDALQFLEGVAQVIENVAGQQRLLALVAIKNCDLRCATA